MSFLFKKKIICVIICQGKPFQLCKIIFHIVNNDTVTSLVKLFFLKKNYSCYQPLRKGSLRRL